LHAHQTSAPDFRAIAEQLSQTDCHGRGCRLALRQDVVQVLAGNPQKRSDLGFGLPGCRITSRNSSPGCIGHRLGLRFAGNKAIALAP
jgi:hypothetical protein